MLQQACPGLNMFILTALHACVKFFSFWKIIMQPERESCRFSLFFSIVGVGLPALLILTMITILFWGLSQIKRAVELWENDQNNPELSSGEEDALSQWLNSIDVVIKGLIAAVTVGCTLCVVSFAYRQARSRWPSPVGLLREAPAEGERTVLLEQERFDP